MFPSESVHYAPSIVVLKTQNSLNLKLQFENIFDVVVFNLAHVPCPREASPKGRLNSLHISHLSPTCYHAYCGKFSLPLQQFFFLNG